ASAGVSLAHARAAGCGKIRLSSISLASIDGDNTDKAYSSGAAGAAASVWPAASRRRPSPSVASQWRTLCSTSAGRDHPGVHLTSVCQKTPDVGSQNIFEVTEIAREKFQLRGTRE